MVLKTIKSLTATSLAILTIILIFSSCAKNDVNEPLLIYYNDSYYDCAISDDYRYNDFWYPLTEPDEEATAFYCEKNCDVTKLDNGDKIQIKKFSDAQLNMFVSCEDFWGEWLYCDVSFEVPSLNADNIESIVFKKFSVDDEWCEYYKSDNCIKIQDKDEIDSLITSICNIDNTNKTKSFTMSEVQDKAELCIKFKDINALYYLGVFAYVNDDAVFYDSHKSENVFYLIDKK